MTWDSCVYKLRTGFISPDWLPYGRWRGGWVKNRGRKHSTNVGRCQVATNKVGQKRICDPEADMLLLASQESQLAVAVQGHIACCHSEEVLSDIIQSYVWL